MAYGYWIDKPSGAYGRRQSWCSACGKHSGIGGIESNRHKPFCPNCGAAMVGQIEPEQMEDENGVVDYDGLKQKYFVFKAHTGELVEDSFVLVPGRDKAATEALAVYATATDNERLSMDLWNWLENGLHFDQDYAKFARVVRCVECKHSRPCDDAMLQHTFGYRECMRYMDVDEETGAESGFSSVNEPYFFCANGERKSEQDSQ